MPSRIWRRPPPLFFDQHLTATDSIKLSNFGWGCFCFQDDHITIDDTLLVFADGIETPVEVEIINGQIVESEEGAPLQGVNLSVHPNPSPGGVAVLLALETPAHAAVSIRDIRGRTVATLVDGALSSGEHTFLWDHSEAASGVYIVHARTGESAISKTVTIAR